MHEGQGGMRAGGRGGRLGELSRQAQRPENAGSLGMSSLWVVQMVLDPTMEGFCHHSEEGPLLKK